MKNNVKIFFASFFISCLLFGTLNLFYSFSKAKNAKVTIENEKLKGEISDIIQEPKDFNQAKENILDLKNFPEISAKSAISLKIYPDDGREEILFQKNIDQRLAIASLTKLMTAIVADEFIKNTEKIKIDKEIVNQPEAIGELKIGEVLNRDELLKIMLMESSNDAAFALAKIIGEEGFVQLMNWKAKEFSMENTYFFNPMGIDEEEKTNYSTARDLTKLAREIIKKKDIMDILALKEYPLYLSDGTFHHNLKNTNELLGEIPAIIGGKTGYTQEAKGCLLEILKAKEKGKDIFIINVVLVSLDRFDDMRKIINFLQDNFNFEY